MHETIVKTTMEAITQKGVNNNVRIMMSIFFIVRI